MSDTPTTREKVTMAGVVIAFPLVAISLLLLSGRLSIVLHSTLQFYRLEETLAGLVGILLFGLPSGVVVLGLFLALRAYLRYLKRNWPDYLEARLRLPHALRSRYERTAFAAWRRRVSGQELADFSRELADLLDAGVPLTRCLEPNGGRVPRSASFQRSLDRIRLSVERGSTLSEAINRSAEAFDPVYVAMVSAGERKGELGGALRRVAAHLEWSIRLTGRLRRRLVSSYIIILGGTGILLVLFLAVIPVFERIFADFG